MRSMRSELASVLTVMAVPAAVVLVFPRDALVFRATPSASERPAPAAFVRLTAAEESLAIRKAKTSWQEGSDVAARNLRANVFFPELPKEKFESVMSVEDRRLSYEPGLVCSPLPPFLPSRRAKAPQRIVADGKNEVPLPFPREELLKIDR